MDNEILYREFWVKCTESKLIDLTRDFQTDARVQDFDKMESDICKSDAEYYIRFVDWVLPIIEPQISVSDTVGRNRIRMMKVMREKLQRRSQS